MKSLAKTILGIVVVSTLVSWQSSDLLAQDLDDSLESEIDALSTGPGAGGGSTSGSSDLDSALDDEPLADPFGDEKPSEKTAEKSDTKPAAPKPIKPSPKSIAKPAAPTRSEPTVSHDSLAPTSDEPNPDFEARLAAIYANNSEPVSDEKWSGMLGSRAAESYSVQAGDTLWDLSQTLFADGFYWSKLWAENPEIHNPHQIEKGQAIRFIGGTEASPPEIRVVKDVPDALTVQTQAAFEKEDVVPAIQEAKPDEISSVEIKQSTKFAGMTPNRALNQAPYYQEDIEGKITQADIEAGVVIEQGEIVPRPVLPPPSEERRKVLLNIPRSFREFKYKHFERSVTIQRRSNLAEKIPAAVVPPYIAFEKVPEPMGEIAEVDNHEVASLGQTVVISANESLAAGTKVYSVFPRHKITGGRAYEIGGVLRVGSPIKERSGYYRATVVYGVNAIRVDSLVLAGEPPRMPVTTTGRRFTEELKIVGGSYADTRYHFGDGAMVFLDSEGTSLRAGDVLAVQARRGNRRNSVIADSSEPIGVLKVFSVNGAVASAFVVTAIDDIRTGDKTGPAFPTRLPDLRNEPPRVSQVDAK